MHMKLSGGQTSCQHQRVAFDCCIRGYGLITHFIGTHGNRKYVHLCKRHQERHKQCCATGLRGMWSYSSSNPKVSSFHTKRSDELMCESRNGSEAAGAVWVDSPYRRLKYLQTKWLELQTSESKASDSIYSFRYPQSEVPLWSIYKGLVPIKVFQKAPSSALLWLQLTSSSQREDNGPFYAPVTGTIRPTLSGPLPEFMGEISSWCRQLKSEFTIAEIFHHIIESYE